MSGVSLPPIGSVQHSSRLVAYFPDPNAFGIDTFSYLVSDCAFNEDRSSAIITVNVRVDGISNVPYIASETLSAAGMTVYCPQEVVACYLFLYSYTSSVSFH